MTLPKIIIESKDSDAYCGIILDEKDYKNGITLKVELSPPDLIVELKIPPQDPFGTFWSYEKIANKGFIKDSERSDLFVSVHKAGLKNFFKTMEGYEEEELNEEHPDIMFDCEIWDETACFLTTTEEGTWFDLRLNSDDEMALESRKKSLDLGKFDNLKLHEFHEIIIDKSANNIIFFVPNDRSAPDFDDLTSYLENID